MINWDGDVHRATCRVGGSLGNIYKGTFNKPTESLTAQEIGVSSSRYKH